MLSRWHGYPVKAFSVGHIFPRCKPLPSDSHFIKALRESLETEGLKVPLTLVKTTLAEATEYYGEEGGSYIGLPKMSEEFYLITVGNQRYHLLKEMGWTEFPCVVVEHLFRGKDMTRWSKKGFEHIHRRRGSKLSIIRDRRK